MRSISFSKTSALGLQTNILATSVQNLKAFFGQINVEKDSPSTRFELLNSKFVHILQFQGKNATFKRSYLRLKNLFYVRVLKYSHQPNCWHYSANTTYIYIYIYIDDTQLRDPRLTLAAKLKKIGSSKNNLQNRF